jgi:carbamoyl-phosphate synthase small subunit
MPATSTRNPNNAPPGANAALVLADGRTFWGRGVGANGTAVGEVCFNTSITGYQEIMTDPSYAGQIITFTFPHIGNVGTNPEDVETLTPAARGCVIRADISEPSNWRAVQHFDAWLKSHNLVGIAGVDTRALTIAIREGGATVGAVGTVSEGSPDSATLAAAASEWPGLEGMDLAREVSCTQSYTWNETRWALGQGYGKRDEKQADLAQHHVVAVDFGAKHNILRCLASLNCRVTVVPATATAEDVLRHNPDGVFLSNGPGDPSATGIYAVPMVRDVIASGLPVFGICLGHQIMALALGAKTEKMHHGHRGANHPVKDIATGKVEITSQNHGFVVVEDSLPDDVAMTHVSLFDGSLEGIALKDRSVFSVQYHPEASPGPQDSHYLFERFVAMMDKR